MNRTESLWEKDHIWISVRTVVVALIAVVNVIGNTLCLVILPRLKSIPENNRMLLMILSASDLAVGIHVAFLTPVAYTNMWPYGHLLCQMHPLLLRALLTTCLGSLVLISMDRYIAISKPLHYHWIVTKKRVLLALMVIFLIGFIPSLNPLPWKENVRFIPGMVMCMLYSDVTVQSYPYQSSRISGLFLVISGLFITLYVYTRLFYITHTQLNKIHDINNDSQDRRRRLKDAKALRMFFGCTLTFIASWVPITIYALYAQGSGKQPHMSVYFFCYWAALAGSGLDVLTLFATNSSFRQSTGKLLFGRCFSSCKTKPSDTTSVAFSNRQECPQ